MNAITIINGMALANSGNLYVAGTFGNVYSGNLTGSHGYFIEKRSSVGTVIWIDSVQVLGMGVEGKALAVDNNENLYLALYCGGHDTIRIGATKYPSNENMYLVKYDSSGQIQWVKYLGNGSEPHAMTIDQQNNIYVTGQCAGDWFITKFDQEGNTIVNFPYGGICISIDNTNNIYIPGKKIDPAGNIVWTSQPVARMAADSAGNTYITDQGVNGVSNLTKVNQSGQIAWSYTVPYQGGYEVYCHNNEVYVAGEYGSSNSTDGMCVYKYDGNGNQLWSWQLPNPTNLNYPFFYTPHGNIKTVNGIVYLSGFKQMQCAEAFLMKISEPGIVTFMNKNEAEDAISISPNPSASIFYLTIRRNDESPIFLNVVNALGKTVYTKQVQDFGETVHESIDLAGLPKGIYILELNGEKIKKNRKLIVE